jgi:hypothetical protein
VSALRAWLSADTAGACRIRFPARDAAAAGDTSTGRLMLAVLGGFADVEQDLIRTRAAESRGSVVRFLSRRIV